MAKTVNGREQVWQIQELVGSGDAGEVLRVSSQPGKQMGVMKRPLQNVSGGTIVRQATQIETEGKILSALEGINFTKNGLTIHTPILLDQSIDGTSRTAHFFIISEEIRGKSITSMLTRHHSGVEPIPQNMLLTVLSSLLLLLERIHERGIIWNDVKTDHIFWQDETKTMSFIDWGNGFFLQPQADLENSPIWQDYQQLFEEGTNLLNQTSPNLIHDLGLPSTTAEMSMQEIKQLRLRVDYLEMYLSMRAVEYQLLFQRFSKSFASHDALEQTLDLQKELNALGIQVDSSEIFQSAKTLLLNELDRNTEAEPGEILKTLNTYLPSEIPANWKLAEYLIDNGQSNKELIELVLESNWIEAVWTARSLIQSGDNANLLGKVIYSMRDLHLSGASAGTIYAGMLGFAKTLNQQAGILDPYSDPDSQQLKIQTQKIEDGLRNLASDWARLPTNEALGEKFLSLKQLLTAAGSMRLRIPTALNDLLQKSMLLIREIYQSWNNADFPSALKAIKKLYITEPTLDYLLPMYQKMTEIQEKINLFIEGPEPEGMISQFAQELFDYKSPLTTQINQTNWQNNYNSVLNTMINALSLEQLRDIGEAQNWPTRWLFKGNFRLKPAADMQDLKLTPEQKQALNNFHQHLMLLDPASINLNPIKELLPAWHASYKQLAEEFLFALSSLPREQSKLNLEDFPKEDHAKVKACFNTLSAVEKWKKIAISGDWLLLKLTSETYQKDWLILDDLRTATTRWNGEILSAITEIKQRNWNSGRYKQILNPHFPALNQAQGQLFSFNSLWQKIEFQGLYTELLNDLNFHADQAQSSFFRFWQELQRSPSPALVWLATQEQNVFSEINQIFLNLMRSVKSLQRNYDVVNQSTMARTRLAQNSAGELVFTLTRIDELIRPGQKDNSIFKRWQRQYFDLLSKTDRNSIRRAIQEIETIHPLLPWFDELVRRDAGYFDQPDRQEW